MNTPSGPDDPNDPSSLGGPARPDGPSSLGGPARPSGPGGPGGTPGHNDVLRIIVADDQASVREGLVVLLDLLPDIDVVASAASGQEALDLADEHHPDAILLDLHMPVMDGTEAARLLTARHPDIAIVVLTTYADDTSILAALSAGARSYLTKDADRSTIAQALRGAASGLSVLAPSAHATLLTAAAAAAAAAPPTSPAGPAGELPAGLTPREAEILTMIGRGMTNAEIAQTLVLSNHTIKTHINRIFAKTGSANRTEASRFARAHGLT